MIEVHLIEIDKDEIKSLGVVEMLAVPKVGDTVSWREYKPKSEFNIYEVTHVNHSPQIDKYVKTREEEIKLEIRGEIIEYDAEVRVCLKYIGSNEKFWNEFATDKKLMQGSKLN